MIQNKTVRFLDRRTPPHIATLVAMTALSAMTINVFLPALPAMTEHFGTEYRVMQLSVAVFLATNAMLQLLIGPLSDRYGRRPVLLAGIAAYLVATVAAIYAPSAEAFLAFRAAQAGVVTGLVLSRAIVRDIVPGERAASMIAYITMGMSVVPMVAPTVGGVLTGIFGWQSNFWLLFSLGCGLLLLVYFDVGETLKTKQSDLRQTLRGFPELLSSQRFLGYAACAASSSGAYFAFLGGAPFVGMSIFGMNESTLGLYMATPAIGYFVGNFLAGRFSLKIGTNRMILYGGIVAFAAIGLAALAFAAGWQSPVIFFGAVAFLGCGNGIQIPNATAGSLSVREHLAGTASGLGGTMMIGGGAALSAFSGSVLTEGSGALPLLIIMVTATFASILSALWVIRREKVVMGF